MPLTAVLPAAVLPRAALSTAAGRLTVIDWTGSAVRGRGAAESRPIADDGERGRQPGAAASDRALAELARRRREALVGVEPREHARRRWRRAARAARGRARRARSRARSSTWPGRGIRDELHARLGDRGVRGAAVFGAREAVDEPALLEPARHVREARQRRVRARGELGHAHRALGRRPSAMSTPYSKWVSPASRRSCASSAPGSSSASATRRTQAADSSVFSHFVSLS